MAPEDYKRLVRRYQDIYNQNQLDLLPTVLADDLLTPTILPGLPAGLEGARAAHRLMLEGFPDFETVIDDLVAQGDRVAARITMRGTNQGPFMGIPATGRHVQFSGMYIVRCRDGKIVEHWSVEDAVGLMSQLKAGE